jgi:hypothetical protein
MSNWLWPRFLSESHSNHETHKQSEWNCVSYQSACLNFLIVSMNAWVITFWRFSSRSVWPHFQGHMHDNFGNDPDEFWKLSTGAIFLRQTNSTFWGSFCDIPEFPSQDHRDCETVVVVCLDETSQKHLLHCQYLCKRMECTDTCKFEAHPGSKVEVMIIVKPSSNLGIALWSFWHYLFWPHFKVTWLPWKMISFFHRLFSRAIALQKWAL